MSWQVYLSGEIHTDWRERIERGAAAAGLDLRFTASGAKPGPTPAHPIGIWVGAYGPRMLRLTGRLGDGWLPSLGGHFISAEDAPRMHAAVDEGAKAGREPGEIERAVNVMALEGSPRGWETSLLTS
jgi:alkanesulfonate monooxygenase SsuD/methylene tetrahydromethanopterin reductase-like flavin-dependent oxidoreductase (luciferase family)